MRKENVHTIVFYVSILCGYFFICLTFMEEPVPIVLTIIGTLLVFLLLRRLLRILFPEKAVMQLFLLLFLIVLQWVSGSWALTVLLGILLEVYFISTVHLQKKWPGLVSVCGIFLLYILHFHYISNMPHISDNALQQAMRQMEEDPAVLEVTISAGDEVNCNLILDQPLSLEDQEELGKNCARSLAEQIDKRVDENGLGDVYRYYDLVVFIQLEEDDDVYQGKKARTEKRMKWVLTSGHY